MSVYDTIESIFNEPDMSRSLAEALAVLPGRDDDEEFRAMVARVEGKFESSRNYPVVLQFIQDFSKLRDREVIRLFEFIYSSMVNKFKGELGEVLARESLLAFRTMLPGNPELILGPEIASRQLRWRNGWYAAADALYWHRDARGIEIVGIAEIKSKTTPLPDMREQVERNLLRMRRGLRFLGEEIAPEAIRISPDLATLMIVPKRGATATVPVPHPSEARLWLAELPWTPGDITEAAYLLMSWYFSSRIGPKVFHYRADPPSAGDRRTPIPHEELSLEENGRHSFVEAIYHTTFRKGFDPREIPTKGRRTPWQTLLWIYNSLGFGAQEANADEFKFEPYEQGPEKDARLARYNHAIAAYRAGDFAEALATLPDPAEQNDAAWSRREWLMLARIHARLGHSDSAREAIGQPYSAGLSQSLSLPIESGAVEVLIELAAGDETAARAKLAATMAALERVRAEVRVHEENGWELPSFIEPNSAREGVIDLATAHAALGDCAAAIALLERLRDLRGWELDHCAADPLLSRCVNDRELARLRVVTARRGELAIF